MGLIPVSDSAGVLVRKIDKSQAPAELAPSVLWAAAPIRSERGFICQVYDIYDTYDREITFGKKNWRTYGTSAHEIDMYLKTGQPCHVIRAGVTDHASADVFKLAGMTISSDGSIAAWTGAGRVQTEFVGGAIEGIDDFDGLEVVHIFAKGEGTWANYAATPAAGISITITQQTVNVFQAGDKSRVYDVAILYQGSQVEKFWISFLSTDMDETGKSIFVLDQLNASKYVSATLCPTYSGIPTLITTATTGLLGGAGDSSTSGVKVTDACMLKALKRATDYPEVFDVFLALNVAVEIDNGDFETAIKAPSTITQKMFGISATKKSDALAATTTAATLVTARGTDYDADTAFITIFPDWILGRETETGQDTWMSMVGNAAAVIGNQAGQGQLPYAPAGFRRARITGIGGVSHIWKAAERKTLSDAQWNPLKYDKTGATIWAENTAQKLKTAFSDSHVALSFLAQVRGISKTCDSFVFEFNDEDTVNNLVGTLQDLADSYVEEKYAEQIIVDSKQNVIGSDQIRIRWNIRFKGVAKTVVIDLIAYPSTQTIEISMSEV